MFFFVAFILLFLLPSPWNLVGFVAGLVLFTGEVLFWNRRVRGKRVQAGAETLIGKPAVVTSECRPHGQVRLGGEIWDARCEAGADVGDSVVVTARDDLVLVVERPPSG
jgi:membrane-bound serine protease (ClpP class)